MPDFQTPQAFLMLLFIPILYIMRRAGFFSRLTLFTTVSDWNGRTFNWDKKFRRVLNAMSVIFELLGFVLVVSALAEPVVYKQERVYTSRGTDVLFVLDISPSMAAKDMQGESRIETAKKAVTELVSSSTGASFGIVTMAKEAAIVVPPTIDRDIFIQRLNDIEIGSLGDGTAIGTGLSTASYHLASSLAQKKCIVLVTDGENNAGSIHPETAAEIAARNNITVYTLGIGSSGTVPIDYEDPKTGKKYTGFLNSSFDAGSLRQIAQAGGGRYFEILSLDDLSLALTVISRNESSVQSYQSKTTGVDYYQHLVLLAALSFGCCWFIKRIFLQEYI